MICPQCRGRGENCEDCEGTGFVYPHWDSAAFEHQFECTVCGGGRMVAGMHGLWEWCDCCGGTGRVWRVLEPEPAEEE